MANKVEHPDAVIVNGIATNRVPTNSEGKPICGAVRKGRRPCQQAAGAGTTHPGFGTCKWHAGSMPGNDVAAARQEVVEYVEKMKQLGTIAQDITPDEAIMQEVARCQAAVEYFDQQVKQITSDPDADPASARNTKVIWHWNDQRRMLAQVSSLVIRAGIARRHVEIAEMQASAVLAAVLATLSSPEVGLGPEQIERAKRMIASSLRDLATAPEQRADMALVAIGV